MVAAIELAIQGPLANTASILSADSQIPIIARKLIAEREGYDVVFLGDSSVGAGLDPVYFARKTGLSAVNLGTTGNMTMAGYYFFLDEYLAQNEPPECVVLGCVYDLWPRDLEAGRVSQTLTKYFPAQVASMIFRGFWPPPQALEALLLAALPSVRYRFDMQRLLTWYVGAPGSSSMDDLRLARETNAEYRTRRKKNLGFAASEERFPSAVATDLRYHLTSVQEHPDFAASSLNVHYLGEIVSLGDHYGFTVLFQPMPIDERLVSTAAGKERLRGYLVFLRDVAAQYPAMGLMTDSIPLLPPASFSNTIDHLYIDAATLFTAEVANNVVQWRTSRSTPRI
jgi:hypothetical protein